MEQLGKTDDGLDSKVKTGPHSKLSRKATAKEDPCRETSSRETVKAGRPRRLNSRAKTEKGSPLKRPDRRATTKAGPFRRTNRGTLEVKASPPIYGSMQMVSSKFLLYPRKDLIFKLI